MLIATDIATFTCICCPLGCHLEVSFNEDGTIAEIEGNTCARGKEYARSEAVMPLRMITAVVQVEGSLEPMSVKTEHPVPKQCMDDILAELRTIHLQAPLQRGDIVVSNICDTGVDVIATKSTATSL